MAKKAIGVIYLMVPKDVSSGKMLAACIEGSTFVWATAEEIENYRSRGYERLTKLKF